MVYEKLLTNRYVAILESPGLWRRTIENALNVYGCKNVTRFKTKRGIMETYNSDMTSIPDIAFLDVGLSQGAERGRRFNVYDFFKKKYPDMTLVLTSNLAKNIKDLERKGVKFFIRKTKEHFRKDFREFVKQYAFGAGKPINTDYSASSLNLSNEPYLQPYL